MAIGDNNQVKSKRDLVRERVQKRYPDKDFSDDEAFYGQLNDDFDALDKELSGYKEREKAFSDMFTSDPRSASFITDWRKGEDPTIGLIRRFGPEIKDAIDDPDMQEKIAEANKEYVDRVAASKKLDEEYQKNIAETLSYLSKMQEEKGLPDDKIDNVMEFLVGIVHDGIVGKFSPETIHMAMKALNHDTDVEDADRAGEVRGRNAKINETLRKGRKGDNMPQLDGQNNRVGGGQPKRSLGALDNFAEGDDIWTRGGEKRRKAM
jgi:type I site-specific restriction endonuclease